MPERLPQLAAFALTATGRFSLFGDSADLSRGGGSEEMSSRTEVVAYGAERPEETLGMLG